MNSLSLTIFTLMFAISAQAADSGKFLVVIDPGHGGVDQGAVFVTAHERYAEKDLTLALARKLALRLEANGIVARLTRDGDYEMPLSARTGMANKLGADLFLSIHLNSTADRDPHTTLIAEGVETYILNNETDESSKRLTHLENTVLQGSRDSGAQDPDVGLIIKDLRLDANLPESKRLACAIQNDMVTRAGLGGRVLRRGVRQALFYVLLGADMPSALVETGFITSARDRSVLASPAGQEQVASALTHAIAEFRKEKGTRKAQLSLASCKIH
jgi:N-acetylmuramoyl-L-alanine amidase